MAWTNPADPVTNTVITVAYAVANFLTQIRWLRIMTGNADPPASNRVVVSSSTTATAWGQVPTDAIADLAVSNAKLATDAVTNTKILNQTISGDSKIQPGTITGDSSGSAIPTNRVHANRLVDGSLHTGETNRLIPDQNINGGKILNNSLIGDTKIASSTITGNAGTSAIGTGVIHPNRLVPDAFDANQVAAAFSTDSFSVTNAADIIQDAAILAAHLASGAAATNIGTGGVSTAMLADDAVTADKGGVPLGAVVWFETLAELTAAGANWERHTEADGRLLIGAGTTFSQTFTQATDYGSAWTHSHAGSDTTHIHGATGLTATSGTVAASGSSTITVTGGAGNTIVLQPHTHPAPTITMGGTTGPAGTGATTADTWLPVMRAGIWGRRI